MFEIIRSWQNRRIIERSTVTPEQWQSVFSALPLLDALSADEKRRLQELVILFCHRKLFEGAHGLVVTQPMALIIALQACLLILELGLEAYEGWTTIIVYPSGFAPERVYQDEYGVEHVVKMELSGEAWERGPVLLAWDETGRGGDQDSYNVVIHEFAHKLDMQNGEINGFPPLHPQMDTAAWTRAFSSGFEDFRQKCDAGIDIGIDCYAASSPEEYFAVLSEVFFEQPDVLQRHYAEVYRQMRLYYRQDPLSRGHARIAEDAIMPVSRESVNRPGTVIMDQSVPFDIVVLHDVPPESTDVKTLYEVFSLGREAWGEYLFYGEIDARALAQDGTGDLTRADYSASVEVSFETGPVDDAAYYLDAYRAGSPAGILDSMAGRSLSQLYDEYAQDGSDHVFDVDSDSYSKLLFDTWYKSVTLCYTRLTGVRVTEIRVTGKVDAVSIEWMYHRFRELVARYRDLPMHRFTGALRE